MRYLQFMFVLMLSAVFVGSAFAGDGAEGKKGDRPGRGEFRKKMLEEFDADGDGELSDDERATAREEMRGRRGKDGAKGRREGKGGKGPPSPERLFEKFDADGDNQLSREEFMELAKSMQEHRERHRRSKGQAGKGSGRRGGPPEGRPGPPREGRRDFGSRPELQNPGDRPGPPPRGKEGRRGKGPEGHGRRPPNPGKLFDRFDENEDGQLSREEFMELAHSMRERHGRGKDRMGKGRDGRKGGPGREGRDRPRPEFDGGAGSEPTETDDSSV